MLTEDPIVVSVKGVWILYRSEFVSEDRRIRSIITWEFGASASYVDIVGKNISTYILKTSGKSLPQPLTLTIYFLNNSIVLEHQ